MNKFEDSLRDVISIAMTDGFRDNIDEKPHIDNLRDLLKEHIELKHKKLNENEYFAYYVITEDFEEFLNDK